MIELSDAEDEVMGTAAFKELIVELVRGGCLVERLAYDPPTIVFRNTAGARCALTGVRNDIQLTLHNDRDVARSLAPAPVFTLHLTMHQAIQAACGA